MRACVRASVRACVRVGARACVYALRIVYGQDFALYKDFNYYYFNLSLNREGQSHKTVSHNQTATSRETDLSDKILLEVLELAEVEAGRQEGVAGRGVLPRPLGHLVPSEVERLQRHDVTMRLRQPLHDSRHEVVGGLQARVDGVVGEELDGLVPGRVVSVHQQEPGPRTRKRWRGWDVGECVVKKINNDDDVELHVLGCRLTY